MKSLSDSMITKSKDEKKESSYEIVKKEIETTWPAWKREAYNNNFATSAHSKKVNVQ